MKKIISLLLLFSLTVSVKASNNDVIWGAIVGGIIGNQIGSSEYNQYIGAAVGAYISRDSYYDDHYYRYSPGYYKIIERRVWVAPKYLYDRYGNRILIKEGYWKIYYERIWVSK